MPQDRLSRGIDTTSPATSKHRSRVLCGGLKAHRNATEEKRPLRSFVFSLAKPDLFWSESEVLPAHWAGLNLCAQSALLLGVCRVGWGSRPRSSRQGA